MAGEFRADWFTRDYDTAVAFYRDVLELPVVGGWDRAADDKGTLFGAAAGIVEVMALHDGQEYVPPQSVGLLVEVDDVDAVHARLAAAGHASDPPVDKPWGHRQFTVIDPDGVRVTLFAHRA